MKELKEFTVGRLEQVANTPEKYDHRYLDNQLTASEARALAKIALAAKKTKPSFDDWLSSLDATIEVDCGCVTTEAFYHWIRVAYDATPPLNHAEQSGWTSSDSVNAALVMLDRIDTTDPVDDDRIEDIKRIIRQLSEKPTEQHMVAPDGWKLVPIEPTESMVISGFESEPDKFFSSDEEWKSYNKLSGCQQAARLAELCYAAMLRAAPKPEM